MGLTVKNKNRYELSSNVADFFSLPLDDEPKEDYENLKKSILSLDIDYEDKANMINKINTLLSSKKETEKSKIKKELTKFKEKYNI